MIEVLVHIAVGAVATVVILLAVVVGLALHLDRRDRQARKRGNQRDVE